MNDEPNQQYILEIQGRLQALRLLLIAYRLGILTREELIQALVDLVLQFWVSRTTQPVVIILYIIFLEPEITIVVLIYTIILA